MNSANASTTEHIRPQYKLGATVPSNVLWIQEERASLSKHNVQVMSMIRRSRQTLINTLFISFKISSFRSRTGRPSTTKISACSRSRRTAPALADLDKQARHLAGDLVVPLPALADLHQQAFQLVRHLVVPLPHRPTLINKLLISCEISSYRSRNDRVSSTSISSRARSRRTVPALADLHQQASQLVRYLVVPLPHKPTIKDVCKSGACQALTATASHLSSPPRGLLDALEVIIWYETHGVRGKVTKSGRKKKGVKAVSISTRQQEVQGWPHSISDIELGTEVQSRFLSTAITCSSCESVSG